MKWERNEEDAKVKRKVRTKLNWNWPCVDSDPKVLCRKKQIQPNQIHEFLKWVKVIPGSIYSEIIWTVHKFNHEIATARRFIFIQTFFMWFTSVKIVVPDDEMYGAWEVYFDIQLCLKCLECLTGLNWFDGCEWEGSEWFIAYYSLIYSTIIYTHTNTNTNPQTHTHTLDF